MKISHRIVNGQHETIIQIHWYSQRGNFLVEAVGIGSTAEEAEKEARLHLGQARAKLNEVTSTTETKLNPANEAYNVERAD